MRKSLTIIIACNMLLFGIMLSLSACGSQPSASKVQTAVAGTLANLSVQPAEVTQVVEVTQVIEVTKMVEVKISTTPRPTEKASATPTPVEATATSSPEVGEPGVATVTETPTPVVASGSLGLSFNQLMNMYADMTDLQKQKFLATLPGKKVSWTGQVYNITTDGTLVLDNPYAAGRVTLKGVPIEQAIKINKGMLVDFTGMIESFEGSFLTEFVIVDAKILRVYEPPTATPRSRHP